MADNAEQSREVIHATEVEVLDSRGRKLHRRRLIQTAIPVTWTLLSANILVFMVFNAQTGVPPLEYAYAPGHGQVFPQLFTYMFVHGSLWHLIGNALVIWMFGGLIERIYGSWRYLWIYVLTGIISALVQNAFAPGVLLGASGAASAPMVMFVRHFPRAEVYLYFVLRMPAWVALVLWIAFNLLGAFYKVLNWPMAYIAHLAGLAAGLLLSLLALPPRGFNWRSGGRS